ncbi:MAG TPA: nicotinate-nucleotide--dimethylbenzimidazole phosphoribosyltransferase [candidate division Zixibacteria bacterium]|nr:nicotinate-nucleotide--dimethylbenzimidazole phosphoribosyltransferase [candidate division Zixibacteria bacterium]
MSGSLLAETLRRIGPIDRDLERAAQARLDSLAKPQGSLGRLEELARRVAAIQGRVPPRLGPKLLFVLAADHGVTEEGVSAYAKEVTAQMVRNFLQGGAAVNVLGRHCGIDIEVVDVGVDGDFGGIGGLRDCKLQRGTANFARGPAMTRGQALGSLEVGINLAREAARRNVFLLAAGDMGIGNTSSAAAVVCGLTSAAPAEIVGRGTGIDDTTLERKIAAIESGLRLNRPDRDDPLDVLAKVGGLEIGAAAGLIIGAAALRLPLVLDGVISTAAAMLATRLHPQAVEVLFASHLSAERCHRLMLERLGLRPILDLRMRLGEGTGACLAIGLIEAAVKIIVEMATFASAGVKEKVR